MIVDTRDYLQALPDSALSRMIIRAAAKEYGLEVPEMVMPGLESLKCHYCGTRQINTIRVCPHCGASDWKRKV